MNQLPRDKPARGRYNTSIELTLNTYSHVLPTMQRKAAEKMDGILGRKQAAC